ncbi:hypothetical protein COMNV_01329 [Commensalibacter sp. Nvir]|nr:hypothetical protein COMNV_01329 [Commensalibacter sp. Nvir]
MAQWRDKRLLEVSASTVNRELNLISAVLTTALKEWGVALTGNPVRSIKRPANPKSRSRRVSREEQDIIAKHLGWDGCSEPRTSSQWTAFAFFLAIETAMRRGELTSIRWQDVHLERSYIHLETTKNGEERDVPLSSKAKKLLRLLSAKARHEPLIPVSPDVLTSLFHRATRQAGLIDLRFHDSRREATTQLSKKLSNVLELSAVTGHKSLNMLKIYYKPHASELAKKLE